MRWIDVLIPLCLGAALVVRPSLFFVGSRVPPEVAATKVKTLRTVGYVLLVVAAIYAAIRLASG